MTDSFLCNKVSYFPDKKIQKSQELQVSDDMQGVLFLYPNNWMKIIHLSVKC